jgi:hypothetical protein
MARGRTWKGRKVGAPPEGEGFVWHTRELLMSLAWRSRSINTVRLLEFLEIEHLAHGGFENGSLLAPFDQLQDFGITRRLIKSTIQEAEALGLLVVKRGKLAGRKRPKANRYRLTYLWTRTEIDGVKDWQEPSDEWKRYRVASCPLKVANIGSRSDTVTVPQRKPKSVSQGEPTIEQALENIRTAIVSEGALLSRSRGETPPSATPAQRERSAPIQGAEASSRVVSFPKSSSSAPSPNGRPAA